MKLKKILSVLLCMCMAVTACFMLTGCGDDESDGAGGPEDAAAKIAEMFFDKNATNYFGKSINKLNEDFNNAITKNGAEEFDEKQGGYYKLGKKDHIGKIKFGGEYDTYVVFEFGSKGLEKLEIVAENVSDTIETANKIDESIRDNCHSDVENDGDYEYKYDGIRLKVKPSSNDVTIKLKK